MEGIRKDIGVSHRRLSKSGNGPFSIESKFFKGLLRGFRLPRRDWRDWFIMATVMGGVSYGLYFVTKVMISTPWIYEPRN